MGGKRKKDEGDAGEEDDMEVKPSNKKSQMLPSLIKNKEKRYVVHAKLKHEKKLEKKKKLKARDAAEKKALELGEEAWLKER